MSNKDNRTVWSSQQGDLRKQDALTMSTIKSLPPQQQTIYLHRDSKSRGGKVVTLIKGLTLSKADLTALAKTLKQACGSGGTIMEGVIEIQGEHREKLAGILLKLGYKVKIAGG
jgi:translation initiation factor 1